MQSNNSQPTNVIDSVFTELVQSARKASVGFALGLTNEPGKREIIVRPAEPFADEYQPPADLRVHEIGDTPSFIAYAKRYGDAKKSLIFYNDEFATLTIDEEPERGEREIVRLAFTHSDEWRTWENLLGKPMPHRTLYQALVLLTHTIEDPEILLSMRTMKMNMTVDHESDLREDGKSIGFLVKSNKGEELKRFPKEIGLRMPALMQDVTDEEAWVSVKLRLDIDMPTEPGRPPLFTLYCSEWKQTLRDRLYLEGETIREALEGYTVLFGTHQTKPRPLGTGLLTQGRGDRPPF